MRDVERAHLLDALEASGGNITRAAERLGLPRNTLALSAGPTRARARRRLGPPPRRPSRRRPVPRPDGPVRGSLAGALRWRSRGASPCSRSPSSLRARSRSSSEMTRALEGVMDKARASAAGSKASGRAGALVVFGLDPAEDASRRAVHAAVAIRQAAAARPARRSAAARCEHRDPHREPGGSARRRRRRDRERRHGAKPARSLDALVAAADPGSVIVGARAAGSLGRHFELAPLAGPSDTEAAYRLVSYAERELGRARFVGRDRELRLLADRFEQARAGEGQVCHDRRRARASASRGSCRSSVSVSVAPRRGSRRRPSRSAARCRSIPSSTCCDRRAGSRKATPRPP